MFALFAWNLLDLYIDIRQAPTRLLFFLASGTLRHFLLSRRLSPSTRSFYFKALSCNVRFYLLPRWQRPKT